ncbi:uncharacterized protein MYCFIDRAFT_173433 [Pseudocercospora fijiensis CIRAD86]|uniref:F-box domain-containing protein n=1 Tax=Pseudocercospora fijiensis (strain CIRAD86) TaxID=383855 RepID=M2Z3Q8_PSEFD|nr:uncharacterized protein MYCFIDRAFT_173433 [Pseudocercospora fijiensis CIRAD86]EME84450.1 hypothetical protein MYCFIDRAFT_173433 [Pseudocercospora fijiensis CIRAD86]
MRFPLFSGLLRSLLAPAYNRAEVLANMRAYPSRGEGFLDDITKEKHLTLTHIFVGYDAESQGRRLTVTSTNVHPPRTTSFTILRYATGALLSSINTSHCLMQSAWPLCSLATLASFPLSCKFEECGSIGPSGCPGTPRDRGQYQSDYSDAGISRGELCFIFSCIRFGCSDIASTMRFFPGFHAQRYLVNVFDSRTMALLVNGFRRKRHALNPKQDTSSLHSHELSYPDDSRAYLKRAQSLSHMGTDMSKNGQQTTNMNLQELPTEIVERIAGNLDIVSLGAFRAASRTIQAKTTKTFAETVVPYHTLTVPLTLPGLQAALNALRFDDIAEQALHVDFRGKFHLNGRPKGLVDRERFTQLLRKLFERLQSLQSVEIHFYARGNFQGPLEVVAALIEQPLPRLHSLKLNHFAIPIARLTDLLNTYKPTLRHVLLSELCACDGSGEFSRATLLAHIRDNMSLNSLRIDHANGAPQPYRSLLLERNPRHFTRVNRAMRDPDTREISHYTFTTAQTNMFGKRAVTLGLNQCLREFGSKLYDPKLPEK